MPDAIADTAAKLASLLRLRSLPFAMKLFADRAEMEAIPRIRRPTNVHTLDQVVAQAARSAGRSGSPLKTWSARSAARWSASVGPRMRRGDRAKHMSGVWFATPEDAAAHQAAMHCVEEGTYRRWRWRRWPRAGSIQPTSPCSTPRPAR